MNSEGEGGGRKSKVKRQKSACHGVAPRRREGGLMFGGWSGCRVGSGENSTFLELAGWGERFSLHPVAYGPAELFRNDAALGRNQSPNHFLRPSCGTYSARARPQGTDPGRDLTVFLFRGGSPLGVHVRIRGKRTTIPRTDQCTPEASLGTRRNAKAFPFRRVLHDWASLGWSAP